MLWRQTIWTQWRTSQSWSACSPSSPARNAARCATSRARNAPLTTAPENGIPSSSDTLETDFSARQPPYTYYICSQSTLQPTTLNRSSLRRNRIMVSVLVDSSVPLRVAPSRLFLCSWSRPVIDGKHRVFLPMNDNPAPPWKWNKANVQSVGGGFLVGASRTPSTAQHYMDPRQRSINLKINLIACFWSADGRSVGSAGFWWPLARACSRRRPDGTASASVLRRRTHWPSSDHRQCFGVSLGVIRLPRTVRVPHVARARTGGHGDAPSRRLRQSRG